MTNYQESHILLLGRIVGNLQSLEFLLRGFLSTIHDAGPNGMIARMPDLSGLQVGQNVPENYMTNYDTLGKLIDNYNTYVRKRDTTLLLDTRVADLRDALAHGRVFGPTASPPFQLLKFDKPINGQVLVTFSETMDVQWFQRQIRLVHTQLEKVYNACKLFAPSMIV